MPRKIALCGLLTACAMIFSYIEFLFPLSIAIPGIKLGLANIVIVIALYKFGFRYALVINMLRIFLVALLFSGLYGMLFALCGGLLSLLVMWLLKKLRFFSAVGVSVAGGVAHNIGQLLIASLLVANFAVFYYLPALLLAGVITGAIIGVLADNILKRLPNI